jgi:hypothetical protein
MSMFASSRRHPANAGTRLFDFSANSRKLLGGRSRPWSPPAALPASLDIAKMTPQPRPTGSAMGHQPASEQDVPGPRFGVSTSVTSRPRRAAKYATAHPMTPPPTTTTSEWFFIVSHPLPTVRPRLWRTALAAPG